MKMMDLIYADRPADTIVDFLRFAVDFLKIKSIPHIQLLQKPIKGKSANSFAAYRPSNKSIIIYAKHRHILDVLRSLAHELVHYKQDLENKLHANSGQTGSNEENEANSLAGQILRHYGKKHPELY